MSLTSVTYILFLTVCVFVYWLLPSRWRRGMLLTASVGFYLYAMPGQLPVMLIYLWLIYGLSRLMVRSGKRNARRLLYAGIGVSLLYLFSYKYLNFTLSFFNGGRSMFSLTVPMGISYVTFQCISYLFMAQKKEIPVRADPVWFFLYALFFAKLTAGPIESPDTFLAEGNCSNRLTWKSTLSSVLLILVGFVKKCAAADLIAPAVNSVFSAPGQADGLSTLVSIALYSAQIYFDFSGYTDIALGSAALFGIRLTENFDHPYAAVSVVDFWRRWHISLTNWLRKYVYFPLGGSRVSTPRRYMNVLIVFLTSGLWHGANLTYVVWGFLHGVFQIFEIALKNLFPSPESPAKFRVLLSRVRTLILVAIGWVFFRADTLGNALRVLEGLFNGWVLPAQAFETLGLSAGAWILFLIAALGSGRVKRYAGGKRLTARGGILCCVILTLITLAACVIGAGSGAANSFIYFNF